MPYARLVAAPNGAAREVGMVLGQLAEGGGLGNFAAALLHAFPTPAYVVVNPVNGQVIGSDDAATVAAIRDQVDTAGDRLIWRPTAGQEGRILLWDVDPAGTLTDPGSVLAAIDQPVKIARSLANVLNLAAPKAILVAGAPLLVIDQADGSVALVDFSTGQGDPFAATLAGRSLLLQAVRTKADV